MKLAWHDLPPLSRRAGAVGMIAMLVSVVGGWNDPPRFFEAWLVTWLFLLGIALASMLDVMIHELTGGHWGFVLRPALESANLTLPLIALLAVPLAFGLPHLFAWAQADAVAHSEVLRAKSWYLNRPGFLLRNGVSLAVWSAMALALHRRLRSGDEPSRRRIAVAGLLVYLGTITFAAYDWIASLAPFGAPARSESVSASPSSSPRSPSQCLSRCSTPVAGATDPSRVRAISRIWATCC